MLSDRIAPIGDLDGFLSLKGNASLGKLNAECLFIEGLEEAWPKGTMNFDGGSNEPLTQFLIFQAS
jgi:hypothetical protein